MAITDIQISEELETNAPSIKYTGNEGPKSPQEEQQMMAGMMDQIALDFEIQHGYDISLANPEMREAFKEEWKQKNFYDSSSRGPILPSPEDPVNPFQPKPQGPVLPDRQMAAYGGIMGMDGRRQYGIGSSLKKFVRKVIPNEVSEVAVKAAPFVAPFNPQLAAAMAGIGGFDQTGRIGSSLKNAAITYGLGQLGRQIGGAGFQDPSMSLQAFTNLSSPTTGASIFGGFGGPKAAVGQGVSGANKAAFTSNSAYSPKGNLVDEFAKPDLGGIYSADNVTQKGIADLAKYPVTDPASVNKASGLSRFLTKAQEYIPTSFGDVNPFGESFDIKKAAGAFGIYQLGKKLLGEPKQVVDKIMDRGEGLDLEGIRTEVLEAYRDPSGEKLKALSVKYPYIHQNKDVVNVAQGGRIGFNNGGGIMDLGGMEKDYRNTGGFVDIGEYEKKDDVPARLSVNEFVMTADAVRGMGDGDIDLGAKRMENLMGAMENKKGAQQMFDVSERLSEVV